MAINEAIALVQQQLKNQELPWQALLDSAGEGIWGVDLDGDCTFVNRAALRMIGFSSEELVGQNMHDMVHHHRPDGSDYPKEECILNDVVWNKKPFAAPHGRPDLKRMAKLKSRPEAHAAAPGGMRSPGPATEFTRTR